MESNEKSNAVVAGQDGGFLKSCSTYSIDNESGYEDAISDANDTLNDTIEQESTDTGCEDTSSTSYINLESSPEPEDLICAITNDDTVEDGRNSADTFADDISLLSLDHLSHTR